MKKFTMRRTDRETTEERAYEILRDGTFGVLSTFGEDGKPYGVPVNYAYEDGKIYFHCAPNVGHKEKNLEFCDEVSFCTVTNSEIIGEKLTSSYSSVIVFGTAKKSSENKKRGLELIVRKYAPDFIDTGMKCIESSSKTVDVYEITVEKISGKENLRSNFQAKRTEANG